jgi:hypothetical protein
MESSQPANDDGRRTQRLLYALTVVMIGVPVVLLLLHFT